MEDFMGNGGIIKNIGAGLLTITTVLSLGVLSACSCEKQKTDDTIKPNEQQTISSSIVQLPTQDEKPAQQTVLAENVVDSVLGQKDFEYVFNNALVSIIEKEYPDYAVQEVKLESVDIGQNGSFVLDVLLKK